MRCATTMQSLSASHKVYSTARALGVACRRSDAPAVASCHRWKRRWQATLSEAATVWVGGVWAMRGHRPTEVEASAVTNAACVALQPTRTSPLSTTETHSTPWRSVRGAMASADAREGVITRKDAPDSAAASGRALESGTMSSTWQDMRRRRGGCSHRPALCENPRRL
jgi:hypothetical protein